jgi:hypothetical protein
MSKCSLLGGTFAIIVQFVLGFVCFSTLVIKRHYEIPKRDLVIWTLDGLKQGIGSSVGHFANIILASILASRIVDGDECEWYCLNYLTDASFGVSFNVASLLLVEYVASKLLPRESLWLRFGEYGSPPSFVVWLVQLLSWLFIVLAGKVIVFSLFFFMSHWLDEAISFVFDIFHGYPKVELVVVMIIIPFVLNIFMFWVQDTFLRGDTSRIPHEVNIDKVVNLYYATLFF